jgi:drug/metabolite transporter (DMT)-like permease
MLGALMLLGLQDALSKYLSVYITIWQFQFLRAIVNLGVLLAIVLWMAEPALLRPKRVGRVGLRSLMQVIATLLFFGSAPLLTMTEMAGGLYTFPLFVAALSSLLPGERVGPRRWLAIAAGFAGTLLMLRPGSESFRAAALMPVGAGFFYALFVLCTRRLCREESPMALVLASNLSILCVSALGLALLSLYPLPASLSLHNPYLFTAWQPLLGWMAGIIVICGLLNSLSNLGLGKAYQSADSAMLAPFDYSYLIFATFWGYVFWREVPDMPAIAGMCIIAAAGIFVAWRERIVKREGTS